jgi:hypothetical protein
MPPSSSPSGPSRGHSQPVDDDDDDVFYLFLQKQQLAQRYIPIGYLTSSSGGNGRKRPMSSAVVLCRGALRLVFVSARTIKRHHHHHRMLLASAVLLHRGAVAEHLLARWARYSPNPAVTLCFANGVAAGGASLAARLLSLSPSPGGRLRRRRRGTVIVIVPQHPQQPGNRAMVPRRSVRVRVPRLGHVSHAIVVRGRPSGCRETIPSWLFAVFAF